MGWASGSYIAEKLWKELKPFIPKDERGQAAVSKIIYEIFADYDADDYEWKEDSLEYTYYKLNKPKYYCKRTYNIN